MDWLQRKSIEAVQAAITAHSDRPTLVRQLGWLDLLLIGIGIIVGGGIFVVTGTAAAQFAGPAIVLSFGIAGFGCALAGLCYAELASALPAAGGAYTYACVTLGKGIGWFIGWSLAIEYLCAASYIAVGWAGYACSFLDAAGLRMPARLAEPMMSVTKDGGMHLQGSISLPAVAVVLVAVWVARRGIALSSRVNSVLVALKLAVLVLFVIAGVHHIDSANWTPFLPANTGEFGHFGWSGVLRGAIVVFVVFLGFDALSTLAQETRHPQRNVPRGIILALGICTSLYIAVALVLTGIARFDALNVPNPLVVALRTAGSLDWLVPLVEIVAISSLASVLLIILAALARIFFAMSQDRLLPTALARIHPRFRTPSAATLTAGIIVATLSSLFPVAVLAQVVSLGTLFVFIAVCSSVLILRREHPQIVPAFRVPFGPVVPLLGMVLFIYMMTGVPVEAWTVLIIWSLLGLIVYVLMSRLATRAAHLTSRQIPLEGQ